MKISLYLFVNSEQNGGKKEEKKNALSLRKEKTQRSRAMEHMQLLHE